MTREEIMAMEAGREMDRLIAERVMGLKVHIKPERQVVDLGYYRRKKEYRIINWEYAGGNLLRSYSTDIGSAWEVVEKLIYCYIDHSAPELGIDVEFFIGDNGRRNVATAPTVPLAICRAALIAVMEGE